MASSVLTSTPVNGSSSRMTRPSWASARARNTRFFWPPESSPIWRLRKSLIPTRSSACSTFTVRARWQCAGSPCGRSGPSSRRPRPERGSSSRRPRSAAHRRQSCVFRASPAGWPRCGPRPGDGRTKPMIALNRVDLPLPLTPTSAADRARPSSKLASRSAVKPLRIGDGDVVDGKAAAAHPTRRGDWRTHRSCVVHCAETLRDRLDRHSRSSR